MAAAVMAIDAAVSKGDRDSYKGRKAVVYPTLPCRGEWSHGESNRDRDIPPEVEESPETLVSQGLEKKRRRMRRGTK